MRCGQTGALTKRGNQPADDTARNKVYPEWKKAVTRTFDWVER